MNEKQEYLEHPVFETLKTLIDFYDSLSIHVFYWMSVGTGSIANLDTYVFSSIHGTLESIDVVLKTGRINDAFALLRKYYDSTIINVYTNLYLDDKFGLDNFLVEEINNWLIGKEKLPEYRTMSRYIRESKKLNQITDLILSDDRYKSIRDYCNNHTHYNFYRNMIANDNKIYNESRSKELDNFNYSLETIFIQHFAYIFYLSSHFMMASDYKDTLEFNSEPEPGEKWVAPFIKDVYEKIVKRKRIDIAKALVEKTGMELE